MVTNGYIRGALAQRANEWGGVQQRWVDDQHLKLNLCFEPCGARIEWIRVSRSAGWGVGQIGDGRGNPSCGTETPFAPDLDTYLLSYGTPFEGVSGRHRALERGVSRRSCKHILIVSTNYRSVRICNLLSLFPFAALLSTPSVLLDEEAPVPSEDGDQSITPNPTEPSGT